MIMVLMLELVNSEMRDFMVFVVYSGEVSYHYFVEFQDFLPQIFSFPFRVVEVEMDFLRIQFFLFQEFVLFLNLKEKLSKIIKP